MAAAEAERHRNSLAARRLPLGYYRNSKNPNAAGVAVPADGPTLVSSYCSGGSTNNSLHLDYYSALVQEAGFTTTFTPNTLVPYTFTDGNVYDIDFNSNQESATATGFTYAAVTSRSYHAGGVNVLLMDGSVRFVTNGILRTTG